MAFKFNPAGVEMPRHLTWDRPIPSVLFTLVVSAAFLIFYNRNLWSEVLRLTTHDGRPDWRFTASLFLILLLAMNAVMTLVGWRQTLKPVSLFLVLIAAIVHHFMSSFGVLINQDMIRNVVETNFTEARDLVTVRLAISLAVGAALPIWIILRQPVRFAPMRREMAEKGLILVVSLGIIAATILLQFPQFAAFFLNHRHVRHMITPVNAIYATSSFVKRTYFNHREAIRNIGQDAIFELPAPERSADGKRIVFFLVLGETARAKNFSLQGYPRRTNPELEQSGGIYFSRVSSCGTSTAASVPCMFSPESRSSFSHDRNSEGLLDVLAHAGAHVVWRDNNSGCKGVCDRVQVTFENMTASNLPEYCFEGLCLDDILLDGLEKIMAQQGAGPLVIVLHQQGSHGPAYFKRYPPAFRHFMPTCDQADIGGCDRQSIVNAYDNTLLYTDYVLGKLIALLKRNQERYHAAMLYVSDHGESLGENNLYLHGLPYIIAPEEQTHVPMYLWLSPSFNEIQGLDPDCIARLKDRPVSHDNLFHTVLGLLNVRTAVRAPRFDLTSTCRRR